MSQIFGTNPTTDKMDNNILALDTQRRIDNH